MAWAKLSVRAVWFSLPHHAAQGRRQLQEQILKAQLQKKAQP